MKKEKLLRWPKLERQQLTDSVRKGNDAAYRRIRPSTLPLLSGGPDDVSPTVFLAQGIF